MYREARHATAKTPSSPFRPVSLVRLSCGGRQLCRKNGPNVKHILGAGQGGAFNVRSSLLKAPASGYERHIKNYFLFKGLRKSPVASTGLEEFSDRR